MGSTGSVAGLVTDPSGGIVVGATITLTDKTTNASRTTVSNDAGRYFFSDVPPGSYEVSASQAGFSVAKVKDLTVNVGVALQVDFKLEIGQATQTVEVTATGSELQTMNATVGNVITGVALDSLPGLGRDVSTFVSLQPGVAPDGSVAGANQDQNSFMLDGGNNSSDMDGTMNTYTPGFAGDPSGGLVNSYATATGVAGAPGGGGPSGVMPTPVDSIEEFTVGTTNQTADFNSSAGAQVQMVTKRGTNTWHGTAYEYYLDNKWNANTFDNNAAATPIPSYHYNRFGASAGGPVITKNILGGGWFIFANYEGFRWPGSTTVRRAVPSDGMKLGLLQFAGTVYNLNPGPVTYPANAPAIGALVPGTTYPGSGTTLDPRSLGISPTIQAMWKFMPESNVSDCGSISRCDHLNVLKFQANMAQPWKDNIGVFRLDHDFGSKWHFYSTYRYYRMERATNNQVDIGGFFAGDTLGVPASISSRPQVPWYLTASLTTNLTTNVTNNFHYSYLRNYWARASMADPPQVPGLGGALEPFGESSSTVLAPYNLNTQSVRTRFWDGQDHMVRDDVAWLKGTHFLQFGGTYQRNWNYHQRTDNGGGINYQTVYQLGASLTTANGMDMTGFTPAAVAAAGLGSSWARDYGIVLGVPGVTQIAYTRTGSNLTLNPPSTPAFDQSTIPFYNLYASDSWRIKPTVTLTYGLGWTLEMPPVEAQGKQVILVDANNNPIDTMSFLSARESAALNGQVYNPQVGFSLVGNVAGHPKYPYNPYYKSFSPRIAAAWNPSFDNGPLGLVLGHGKSVVRGGYSILYGRLNGVDLVLVPLLGTGLIQAVQCNSPTRTGGCGGATPNTAFRIGPAATGFDGLVAPLPAASQTLPQPDFPGINAIAAGAGEGLDPNFRPSMSHQFDLTIQRQISNKVIVELGYIGRIIRHEFQPININAVPYMMTLGGQSFAKAYGQMVMQFCGGNAGLAGGGCARTLGAVTPQPFFETALNPSYCVGFASCTAAVASKEADNIQLDNVWTLWSDLDNGVLKFPRSMMNTPIPGSAFGANGQLTSGVGMNTSVGYGNYNAGFASVKMTQWRGLTAQSNFTYGKALGTGSEVQATSQFTLPDAYNVHSAYGFQPWDRKFLFNTFLVYQPPFYKSQQGIVGHLAGGWTFAPIFTTGSGLPLEVSPSDAFANEIFGGGQAFGEGEGLDFAALQNAVRICPNNFGSSRHNNPVPSTQGLGSSWFGPSMFQNPDQSYACFRNPILGIDPTDGGGQGIIRGMPFWNVDFSLKKNIVITERFGLEFQAIFSNLFNHNQLSDPYLVLGDPGDWGGLGGLSGNQFTGQAQANNPRNMEFGLRFRF
ncbi:MAG TPA: carboxypeptidase-like regulatory domain-containing protein [Candidatus Methylomirabilis sp.]|nr:carboxypeptidase-like regulatory domain-containing protein [Candidatus Methylomirabilis sp.]